MITIHFPLTHQSQFSTISQEIFDIQEKEPTNDRSDVTINRILRVSNKPGDTVRRWEFVWMEIRFITCSSAMFRYLNWLMSNQDYLTGVRPVQITIYSSTNASGTSVYQRYFPT